MKKILLVSLLAATVAFGIQVERKECIEDHGPPPTVPPAEKIGDVAGYGAFTLFLGDGAYGLDQTTIDTIEGWNENFQANEYDPRQEEANAIRDWINGRHVIETDPCPCCGEYHATMAAWEAERDDMLADLHEINEEIDAVWADLTDDIRALVPDEDYSDFLDAN